MRIYNTLTKQIEEFVPHDKNNVTMYTCGPTVYHYAHIGNLRYYVFTDILEKTLRYVGYKVTRAMNITDVGHLTSDGDTGEDKMEKGARREGKSVLEIAQFYTDAFLQDFAKLNIKMPDIMEKASDHIDEYINIITKLLDNGHAYLADNGNIYFDISKVKNYYELSGKSEKDLIIGAREDVEEDKFKRNPYDFALWFATSKFENHALKWNSPWGEGYPGWHIECSGISMKYLGEYLDIHCGAVDLVFPHHTNEIAQSEAYLGHKWCNYWVHCEHLNDTTGKMSKSKGDFLTLSVLESKGYDPFAYRFFCLQSHYRNQLEFSFESLDTASLAYQKLKNKISELKDDNSSLNMDKVNYYKDLFGKKLSEDLNTANALTCLFEMLKDNTINDTTKLYLIKDFDNVLSLDLLSNNKIEIDDEIKNKIEKLISDRNNAKEQKNYQKADEIRDYLKEKGIIIKDTKEGTSFEVDKGGIKWD